MLPYDDCSLPAPLLAGEIEGACQGNINAHYFACKQGREELEVVMVRSAMPSVAYTNDIRLP